MKALTITLILMVVAVSGIAPLYGDHALTFTFSIPQPDSNWNPATTTIAVRYDAQIDSRSIADTVFSVRGSASGRHSGKAVLASDGSTVVFTPDGLFTAGEIVQVTIADRLSTVSGAYLAGGQFSFTVSPATAEERDWPDFSHAWGRSSLPQADLMAGSAMTRPATLPGDFPLFEVLYPAEGVAEGYLFLANVELQFPMLTTPNPYLVILDNEGEPVFYRKVPSNGPAFDFKRLANGLLSYGDLEQNQFVLMNESYEIVDKYSTGNGFPADMHDFQLLANGHVLMLARDIRQIDMSKIVEGGDPNALVIGLVVQELDVDKSVIFQWRSLDHLDVIEFTDSTANLTRPIVDYVHGNAVELDSDGNILISSRALDEITKISRQDGTIIWRLGGVKNEFTFINDDDPFYDQHDIRRLPNGHITILDNHTPGTASRAVEYELEENSKTATLVWEYWSDGNSRAAGNAQRLSNGNTAIGWGLMNPTYSEVKPDGSKSLEINLVQPDPQGNPIMSYRVFRFPWHGDPPWKPRLLARQEGYDIRLHFSWNGATEVTSYRLFVGSDPGNLALIDTVDKAGFETTYLYSPDLDSLTYYQVVALDDQGAALASSNLAFSGGLETYLPLFAFQN